MNIPINLIIYRIDRLFMRDPMLMIGLTIVFFMVVLYIELITKPN
jgi:hypothetical protein